MKDCLYTYEYDYESDLSELMIKLVETDIVDKESIVGLKIEIAYPEPIVKNLNINDLIQYILDRYEDRFEEDYDSIDLVKNVLLNNINFDKINEELKPITLYYPKEDYIITQEDYDEAFKE